MVVLKRLIDRQEADPIDHFRRRLPVDDGSVNRAIGEPCPQRAADLVETARRPLPHAGLKAAVVEHQFPSQARGGHGVHRAPLKKHAGDAVSQINADVAAIGEADARIKGQRIGNVQRRLPADREVGFSGILDAFGGQLLELHVVADQRAVGRQPALVVASAAAEIVVAGIGNTDQADALLAALDGDVAKLDSLREEQAHP